MSTTIEHVPLTDEESNTLVRTAHDGQIARQLLDSDELIDAATERWLRRETQAGEQAVERLIRGHVRLVEGLVRDRARVMPATIDLDDLRQAGFEALLRVIPTCDPRVKPLHVFARAFIRRAIADAASQSRIGALSSSSWHRRLETFIGRARAHLAEELHREPTTREITARVNSTEGEAKRYGGFELSTISRHIEMQKRPLGIESLWHLPVEDEAIERLVEDTDPHGLRDDVARLPDDVATVIQLRFGLGTGEEPLTPAATARRLGITVPRVTRLTEKGLATLRRLQLGEYVPPTDLRAPETDDLADVVALPDPDDIEIALAAA